LKFYAILFIDLDWDRRIKYRPIDMFNVVILKIKMFIYESL